MTVHKFSTSNNIGGIGEAIFRLLMESINLSVTTVSTDKKWQKQGIDFIVDYVYYDTKFDLKAAITGNLAIEIISQQKNGVVRRKGWLYTTNADCIVYITRKDLCWRLYFFTKSQLLYLVQKYKDNIKSVSNYGYESSVVLIPLSALKKKPTLDIPIVGNPSKESLLFLHTVHNYLKTNGERNDS